MSGLKELCTKYATRIIKHPWTSSENSNNLLPCPARPVSAQTQNVKDVQTTEKAIVQLPYHLPNVGPRWLFAGRNSLGAYFLNYFGYLKNYSGSSSRVEKHLRQIHLDSQKDFYQKNPQNESANNKTLPKLLYIQNPVVWISNKLDFRFLRLSWDPSFTEMEFTRGARQAVSTVTQLISKNMFDAMKPLLTKNALLNLRRDVEILWADEVRRNIALCPEDVQLIIPRKLHFRHSTGNIDPLSIKAPETQKLLESPFRQPTSPTTNNKLIIEKKFCDIDVLFIGLKWLETHHNPPLVFVDIVARFHRNYSEGMVPDWTISAFKVRRFNVIPQKN